jgi:hypothetical protein
MLSIFELVARLGEPGAGFGTPFYGTRLAAARTFGD